MPSAAAEPSAESLRADAIAKEMNKYGRRRHSAAVSVHPKQPPQSHTGPKRWRWSVVDDDRRDLYTEAEWWEYKSRYSRPRSSQVHFTRRDNQWQEWSSAQSSREWAGHRTPDAHFFQVVFIFMMPSEVDFGQGDHTLPALVSGGLRPLGEGI